MKTIFVQIPAYRDPEILRTVQDLFLTARHPERVFAGVCWQDDLETNGRLDLPGLEQHVRVLNLEARESQGVGWAKRHAQSLFDGEDFVLAIDCHSQFLQGWDDLLLGQLQACPAQKPVLSGVPHPYTPEGAGLTEEMPGFRYPSHIEADGVLRLASARFKSRPTEPVRAPYVVPRFWFAPAAFIHEVPADPHIYFSEEEVSLSVRAWTHGWDVFYAPRVPVWHLYNDGGSRRRLHWREHGDWQQFRERAALAYRATAHGDREQFEGKRAECAPGTVRDVGSFERFAGVNLNSPRISYVLAGDSFARSLEPWYPGAKRLWQQAATKAGKMDPAAGGPSPARPPERARILEPDIGREVPAAGIAPLEIGDQVPYFTLPDAEGNDCHVEIYAGRHLLLHVVTDPVSPMLGPLAECEAAARDLRATHSFERIGVFPGDPAAFREAGCQPGGMRWCLDAAGTLLEVLQALPRAERGSGLVTYVLDPNLRITEIIDSDDIADHLQGAVAPIPAEGGEYPIIAFHPPVIVVPGVLNAGLVKDLLACWESGERFSGKVGAEAASHLDYGLKRRTDVHVLNRDLLSRIDQAFARNLLPELRKITGYDLRYRERHKIGCYSVDDGGAFNRHRDTGDVPLSYRRYAVSLFLNDGYRGGELVFPEYGNTAYKGAPGTAIVFPAPLMHEVRPVTAGRRFILITFLFDERQAAFRSAHRQYHRKPDDTADYRTTVDRHYPGLLTRSIYTRSLEPRAMDAESFEAHIGEPPLEQLHPPRLVQAPPGIMVMEDFLPAEVCLKWRAHSDRKLGSMLKVVDFTKSDARRTTTMASSGRITERVPLDEIHDEVQRQFVRIYDGVLARHYHVEFEWFEAPQMLRYNPGGTYRRHADADHWIAEEKRWVRSQDRDFSVVLYLNDDFSGGELHFPHLNFRLQPKTGMLVAFPSSHRYEHAAETTTEGRRYALVSWGAVLGSQRVKERPPPASVMLRKATG